MTNIRATQGVSFPRSGFSAIYHVVREYFGDSVIFCDAGNAKHCGCRSVPCTNPDRTYAKNHDFGLRGRKDPTRFPRLSKLLGLHRNRDPLQCQGVPILPTERYFIQYRSPVRSITSNFKLHLKKFPDRDNRSSWEMFALRDMEYWIRFVDKWVLNFPSDANPPLYCSYESLLADPQARVREILTYFSEGALDEDRVKSALLEKPIVERNSISEFKYFDPAFFKELEESASGRLEKLNLPSVQEG